MVPTVRASTKLALASLGSGALAVPAGTKNGDLLLAIVNYQSAPVLTPPAGWTLLDHQNANANTQTGIYYRTANNEPASYTWTWSVGTYAALIGLTITGQDPTHGLIAWAGQGSTVAGTVATIPSLNIQGSLLIAAVGAYGITITPPTGYTDSGQGSVAGGSFAAVDVSSQAWSGGITGTLSAALSASQPWTSELIAIQAPGPPRGSFPGLSENPSDRDSGPRIIMTSGQVPLSAGQTPIPILPHNRSRVRASIANLGPANVWIGTAESGDLTNATGFLIPPNSWPPHEIITHDTIQAIADGAATVAVTEHTHIRG